MKKGQIYEGIIERVDFPNKGIVFVPEEEQYVTVKNGIPGQKIRFMINKFKRGNAEGRLLEVLEKSPLETREPVCSIFPACGGCMYQTMPYEEQVKMKEGQIRRIMDPIVKGEYLFEGVKHSPKEFHYRNKMEFSFGDEFKDGPLSLGLHKKGSTYDVLTAGDCQLVHEDMDKILLCVLNYFKERNVSYYKKMQHVGYLRHLLLRRGDTTGEILVNLVTTTQEEYDLNPCQVIAFYDGKECEFEIDLQFRNDNGILFFPDGMLKISVYSTQNLDKSYDQMDDKEKMVYYFLNCRDNGKTKMIENDEVIQTVEKRVETISNDCWTKWIEDFRIQQENELKLEFEEAHKRLAEANKRLEEDQKRLEEANKKVQEANKRANESD